MLAVAVITVVITVDDFSSAIYLIYCETENDNVYLLPGDVRQS